MKKSMKVKTTVLATIFLTALLDLFLFAAVGGSFNLPVIAALAFGTYLPLLIIFTLCATAIVASGVFLLLGRLAETETPNQKLIPLKESTEPTSIQEQQQIQDPPVQTTEQNNNTIPPLVSPTQQSNSSINTNNPSSPTPVNSSNKEEQKQEQKQLQNDKKIPLVSSNQQSSSSVNTHNPSSPTPVNSSKEQKQKQLQDALNAIKEMSNAVDESPQSFCPNKLAKRLECINQTGGESGLLTALPIVASICERSSHDKNSFQNCSRAMTRVLKAMASGSNTLNACFKAIRAIKQDKDAQRAFSRTYDYAQCYLLLLDGLFSDHINKSESAVQTLLGDDFLTELSDVMHAKLCATRQDTLYIVDYLARSNKTSGNIPVDVVNIIDKQRSEKTWERQGIESVLGNIYWKNYSAQFIKKTFLGDNGNKLDNTSKGFIAIGAFYPSVFEAIIQLCDRYRAEHSTDLPLIDQYLTHHEARIDAFLETCFQKSVGNVGDGLADFRRFVRTHSNYFDKHDLYTRFRKAIVTLYRKYEKRNPRKARFLCAGALGGLKEQHYDHKGFFKYNDILTKDKVTNLALTEIYLDNLSGIYDCFMTQGGQKEQENRNHFLTFFVTLFRSSVTHELPKMKEEQSKHMTRALHTFLTDICEKDLVAYLDCLNHSFSILSSGLSVHAKKPGEAFRFVCENYINGLASAMNNKQLTVDNGALVLIKNRSQQSNNQGNDQARIDHLNTRLKKALKPVYEINTKVDLDVLMSNMEYLKSYIGKHCFPLLPGFLAIEMGLESGNTGKYDLYGERIDKTYLTSTRNDQLKKNLPHTVKKHTPQKLLEKMAFCQKYAETAGKEAGLKAWVAILGTYLHSEYGGPFQHHFRRNAFLGNPGLPKKENTQKEDKEEKKNDQEDNNNPPTNELAPQWLEAIPKSPVYGAYLLMYMDNDLLLSLTPRSLSPRVLSKPVIEAIFNFMLDPGSCPLFSAVETTFIIFGHAAASPPPITESRIDALMKKYPTTDAYITFLGGGFKGGYLNYADKLDGPVCFGWQSVSTLWDSNEKNKNTLMALFGWADDDARKTQKYGAGWHIAEKRTRGGDWQHGPESYDYFRDIPRLCQAANSLAAYTPPLRHKREILICLHNSLKKQKQIVEETQKENDDWKNKREVMHLNYVEQLNQLNICINNATDENTKKELENTRKKLQSLEERVSIRLSWHRDETLNSQQQIQQADKTLNIINKSLSLLTTPRKGEHSSLLSQETQSSAPHLSQTPDDSFTDRSRYHNQSCE